MSSAAAKKAWVTRRGGAPSHNDISKRMKQLTKSHGKSHPKTLAFARKANAVHLTANSFPPRKGRRTPTGRLRRVRKLWYQTG